MIGRIRGVLLEKRPGLALIEVGGLGYDVEIPYTTFFRLGETGAETALHTHFAVREDAQSLYGFATRLDRDLFRSLIKTSGVGPKLALAILSGLEAQAFMAAVVEHDVNTLVKIPGVGKKTAERLLIEMSDRIKQLEGGLRTAPVTTENATPARLESPTDEAEAALIALGYRPQEASRAVAKVAEKGMDSEELIRLALRGMLR